MPDKASIYRYSLPNAIIAAIFTVGILESRITERSSAAQSAANSTITQTFRQKAFRYFCEAWQERRFASTKVAKRQRSTRE